MNLKRSFAISGAAIAAITIVLFVLELCKIMNIFDEFVVHAVPEPFTLIAHPGNRSLDVTIVIVLTRGSNMDSYRSALNSVKAYSSLHDYRLRIVHDGQYEACVRHRDKFFRRHCHIHQMMINELPEDSYVLFIDADVGVVNPNKLIEDYIQPEYDIYLYNRFYNWEYAAQYIVKNNRRGMNWVKQWADMEFALPNSSHGTDNGALHILMMKYLSNEAMNGESRLAQLCQSIWEHSFRNGDLFTMQACTRLVIGEANEFPEQHVKIFPKGEGWARDSWLLRSRWSSDDFMLHSIKEQRLRPEVIPDIPLENQEQWYKLIKSFDKASIPLAFPVINITTSPNGDQLWTMDGRLRISNEIRAKLFHRMTIERWQEQYRHFAKHINRFIILNTKDDYQFT